MEFRISEKNTFGQNCWWKKLIGLAFDTGKRRKAVSRVQKCTHRYTQVHTHSCYSSCSCLCTVNTQPILLPDS